MIPYVALLLTVLVISFCSFFFKEKRFARLIFSLIPALLLLLLFSLRSISVGRDTIEYAKSYAKLTNISAVGKKDVGFYFFAFVFRQITPNFSIFLFICGLIICGSLFLITFKYCENPGLGYLIFLATSFSMMLSALRQILATAFLIYGIYFYLSKNKFRYLSIVFLILAFTFHSSSLVFLLVIPLYFLPKKTYSFLFVCFLAIFILLFSNSFGLLFATLNITFYGVTSSLHNIPEVGIFWFVICIALYFLWAKNKPYSVINNLIYKIKLPAFFYRFKTNNDKCINDKYESNFIFLAFLVPIFMFLSSSNTVFPRMAIFFTPFLMIASNATCLNNSKRLSLLSSATLIVCVSLCFVLLFLFDNRLDCVPYSFL